VYVSCWLKWYYPDVFACAILNSMPMGFYQPAQLVIDARNHGVEVRPVDVNYSAWDKPTGRKSRQVLWVETWVQAGERFARRRYEDPGGMQERKNIIISMNCVMRCT
jgi:DNA polymerase III alpha subunit